MEVPRSVLVVEDEGLVGLALEMTLADLGYEVIAVCPTGEEALEVATRRRPDVVLMDITLQGNIDGIETTRRLKGLNEIPVIYVSGLTDGVTRARADATLPVGYLLKPYRPESLRDALQAVFGG